MFKKIALYTIILFSCTNNSFAFTDAAIKQANHQALTYITKLEKTIGSKYSGTLAQMLDFFSDEEGNNAHELMADLYLNHLGDETPVTHKEAFIALASRANEIAQDNINRRPYTKTDLTQFIKDNNKLIQFVSSK
jgi:hypothetical protein